VLDDRTVPRYPRHRNLSDEERALVDAHLRARGVPIIAGG